MAEDRPIELWQGTKPYFPVIGEGGEHMVYQDQASVIKFNTFRARQWLEGRITTDDLDGIAEERRWRHDRLRDYFGVENVPKEYIDITSMVVSRDDCLRLTP